MFFLFFFNESIPILGRRVGREYRRLFTVDGAQSELVQTFRGQRLLDGCKNLGSTLLGGWYFHVYVLMVLPVSSPGPN